MVLDFRATPNTPSIGNLFRAQSFTGDGGGLYIHLSISPCTFLLS